MKGFPNQVAELPKLAIAMQCLVDIESKGKHGKDDGVFGEALVRAGVAGTGHKPAPIEDYLKAQLEKTPSNRSYRTTARGLRELFRLLRFVDDSSRELVITELGRRAASFAGKPMDRSQIDFWRRAIRNIVHADNHGTSYPYQVLLRLVARKPGITRAKCALALEAKNGSSRELDRITGLADLSENEIIDRTGVTKSNWDNAKKVLPRFAEQLGDVIRTGHSYVIADAPGRADAGPAEAATKPRNARSRRSIEPRAPRSSREVTPETIGKAGIAERYDEIEIPYLSDRAAIKAAIQARANRLRRHNLLVREFATVFAGVGAILYEDPFDILALFKTSGILVEVKTLDGTNPDERERVRDALGQLLYYEGFLTGAVAGESPIDKIACFESKIKDEHQTWLNGFDVGTLWKSDGAFSADDLAGNFLGRFIKGFG